MKYVQPVGYMAHTLTIWITVLLAVNRYLAVCKPFLVHRACTLGRYFDTHYTHICFLYPDLANYTCLFFFLVKVMWPPSNYETEASTSIINNTSVYKCTLKNSNNIIGKYVLLKFTLEYKMRNIPKIRIILQGLDCIRVRLEYKTT